MKIAIITYQIFLEVYNIPVGCHETDNLIVFSGYLGRSLYRETPGFLLGQEDMFDEAYIYWGNDDAAEELIRFLVRAGKEVHIVSCGCSSIAPRVAKELSLELLYCSCGINSNIFFLELIAHLV